MGNLTVFTSLFITAFVAATVFPMQSEALLTALLLKTQYAPWLLVMVASIGNILGSCVNWWLGRSLERFKDKKWFPAKAGALERAQAQYNKWGRWSLLLSWVPFVGDPITVMAGVMKERILTFVLLVGFAKTARYVVITLLALQYASGQS